jgi:hypothetical protein
MVILKLDDEAVDCGINLYSVAEIFLKGGWRPIK